MIACYLRVSSIDQTTDRQRLGLSDTIGDVPSRLYEDSGVSGAVCFKDRPAGRRLWEDAKAGTITEVHFWSVDRVGRNVADIVSTLHEFADMGINVIIQKDGIRLLREDSTINPVASLILSVLSSISQMTREQIKIAQMEGIKIAQLQGKFLGRRAGTTETKQKWISKIKNQKVLELLNENYPQSHVARILGVSTGLVRKVNNYRKMELRTV